jgi:hypothetical protein
LTLKQTEEYDLLPSLNLRTQLHLGSPDWIRILYDVEQFLNLTLSLINPALFESGLLMLQKLRRLDKTREIAKDWQSVYTGISIISNRTTPSHRDSRGRPQWFDTLMSYSDPSSKPRLLIDDVGLDLEYSNRTIVSFCGTVMKHQVDYWGDGDRICYAHFMQEEVRNRLDAPSAGWLEQSIYHRESSLAETENTMDIDL